MRFTTTGLLLAFFSVLFVSISPHYGQVAGKIWRLIRNAVHELATAFGLGNGSNVHSCRRHLDGLGDLGLAAWTRKQTADELRGHKPGNRGHTLERPYRRTLRQHSDQLGIGDLNFDVAA